MSYTFKITIPDGPLREHLEGRDPKARNFELIRLATNDLVAMQYGRPSERGVTNTSTEGETEPRSQEIAVKPQKTAPKVDYGNDILNM